MNWIDLKTVVSQIQQACEDEAASGRCPFFFLVGAGISYPVVPLAARIEAECKEVAKKYNRAEEPPGKRPIDSYSHWFEKAYPQPRGRQKYLRQLIEGKPISRANLRLAHLLLEGKVASLVVTPNFDDFLSRALMLFGKPHIVCDHPKTVERIDPDQRDLQIVHVHGTYWFYDCCNLRGEIEERARPSEETTLTMASLLDDILRNRSPLVVGYGGWEGDVIMAALKRRLQSRLPFNLYWFCYRRANGDELPDWLKKHPDVCFVAPPQEPTRRIVSEGESRASEPMALRPRAQMKGLPDKESDEPTLSAQQVLDALIETFQLDAPPLTKDPMGFLAEHLRKSLQQDDAGKTEGDIYFISSVIERIERAKRWETEAIQHIESQLENVRDAMRRLQFREAINRATATPLKDLTETQLRELMEAMWSAALGLYDNSNEELDGYDLVVAIGDMLSKRNIDEPALREQVAKALVNKGYVLGVLNRGEEEIAVYEEVMKRFGDATEPALREPVAMALFNKGVRLGVLNRGEEEIAAYEEVVKRFGEATEPALREPVAGALNGIGFRMLCQAKQVWAGNDETRAREILLKAKEKITAALERQPENPVILGNQGYIAFLLGDKDDAHALLTQAIHLGGEEIRQGELQDADVHPLPQDEEFRELVRSIGGRNG